MDTQRMLGAGDALEFEGTESDSPHEGRNPLLVVHLLLQGRYWLAIVLAILCAIGGGILGYRLPERTFSCTGTVHILPVISSLLFDKNGMMPMYDSFVQTQVVMLRSERCLDMAMGSPRWLNEGKRTNSEETGRWFAKHLEVAREGEIIRVTFTDPDPKTAGDAVAAVIDSYQQLTADLDPDQPRMKQLKLEQLKVDYEAKIADSQKEIQKLADTLTPEAMEQKLGYLQMEANQAETEWKHSKAALENWEADYELRLQNAAKEKEKEKALKEEKASSTTAPATAPAAGSPEAPVAGSPYTMQQLESMSPTIADLSRQLDSNQLKLDQLLLKYGRNYPLVVEQQGNVDFLKKLLQMEIEKFRPPAQNGNGQPGIAGTTPMVSHDSLVANLERDKVRMEDSQKVASELGQTVRKIHEAQARQVSVMGWLGETKQKLEELRVAAAATGRIEIISNGDRPVLHDKRIQIAAASGFGGAILGFGLVILLGLMDHRLRTIDQARMSLSHNMRVLGMLPSLPKNLEDPSAASFAALCVHHIRMLLQVMPRLDGHPAIAVTSPSPGDGKTSLTLALALSYAASGKSTLLIDCDIVGAGMTRRVNAIIRRRIGQILIRENLITPAELREALSASQRSGRKLGEVLVDEGFVDADQLAKALKLQGETSVGLLDVMRGEVLEDCVADTGTPRLWILPVGSALAEHGASISPEGFRAVLEQARKRFDVILIDTGPIPGSIESSVAASQADGVVLTVSRNEQGPLVRRAAEHLRDVGARALGIVFNRATPEDFSSSYGAMSSPSVPERVREKTGTSAKGLGPVAAAVASEQNKALNG